MVWAQRFYYHAIVGSNYRVTNPQAAIGLAQLNKLMSYINQGKKSSIIITKNLVALDLLNFFLKIIGQKIHYGYIQ